MFLRNTSALVLTAAALLGQNDFDLHKTTPGTLGSPLLLSYDGAPASNLCILMVSFSSGPTAISAFDPNDTRSVQVGTELSSGWIFTVSDPGGNGGFAMALPNNAAFNDLVLHWQVAALATSGPLLVGQISNDIVTQTGLAQTAVAARDTLLAARGFSVGFFDRDNNADAGDFIVAGGGAGNLTSASGLASTELWDFRHMQVRAGANMTTSRALHLAVPLNDDRVLIVGGVDGTGAVLASCELYDPTTDSFAATGGMATPRVLHAACRLADGRVMVAGGTSSLADTTSAITGALNRVEIYDPNTGTWSNGPAIGGRRLAPALTLLSNGQVMASGGVEVGFLFGIPISAISTTNVQRWNPSTNSWSNGPNMSQGRAGHHYNQVTLNDGRVLLSGGTQVPSLLGAANAAPISGAELYNPATNSWTVANMPTARALHSANVLPNGDVVVCGGAQGTLTVPSSIAAVERFDPTTNSWTALPALPTPRSGHAAAVMPDGTLLLFGGQGVATTTATIETLRF
ncbi:MAG: hypothetical protein KDC98_05460 [Planctomycetes bacterium]|nr:hypothetical protein [Planctomycetota bacterium]